MFTGLVEAIGTVREVRETGEVFRLSVECSRIAPELILGQSVAVSGACLSVVALRGGVFDVEMMPETVARTRFPSLTRGSLVNLERAMKLDGRLDGHLVLGHVDGTATLEKLWGSARTKEARFRASRGSKDMMRYIVTKGSVAVDGVSLTVIDAGSESFSVGLIPTTLEGCTLGRLKPGEVVNVETDIVGKYVERLLGSAGSGPKSPRSSGKLTLEEMCELGYR
ncbi:MAG: riboflavin synthase [Synergistaceae bacterium]|jgi:riboflavin synthase|nr:riboflavin synthase [Synergistaceae bacterium]